MLLVFDDKIANMEANIKLSPIVTELFLREENSTFHLFLCHNIISKCLKLKDKTQHNFFYYENTIQKRTPTNIIKSFI